MDGRLKPCHAVSTYALNLPRKFYNVTTPNRLILLASYYTPRQQGRGYLCCNGGGYTSPQLTSTITTHCIYAAPRQTLIKSTCGEIIISDQIMLIEQAIHSRTRHAKLFGCRGNLPKVRLQHQQESISLGTFTDVF